MNEPYTIMLYIVGTFVVMLFVVFIILYIIIHKRKHHQFLLEKQEMEHRRQQELMHSRLEVQEQTLKTLSEDLHDNIAPTLGIARMNLLEASMRVETKHKEMIDAASQMMGDAILELRTLSHLMNGTFVLKRGLQHSLEKDVEKIKSAKRIKCEMHVTGEPISLGDDKELITYRILQETVNNAIKHGEPSTIDINLTYSPQGLSVKVADNGKGFAPEEQNENKGMGLVNIQERTKLLNGAYEITSTKNQGTIVKLFIPIENE